MRAQTIAKPFIKWAGGKQQLLAQLQPLLPRGVEHRRYIEPFAGGAALFFNLQLQRAAILGDANRNLMWTYEAVRDRVDLVIAALRTFTRQHNEAQYYQTRTHYNAMRDQGPSAKHAATFIYLNRTCFNGLHRVNRKGEFNVPMGRYKNPRICDVDGLRAASLQLQRTDLRSNPTRTPRGRRSRTAAGSRTTAAASPTS